MYRVYCDEYLIYHTEIEDLEIFSPKLDLELNKTGTFSFTIYPAHPYYDKLKKMKSIICVYQGNYLLFRGRILNDKQGFHNEKQVSCEGELAFLLDSIQRPYDFMSGDKYTTITDLFTFFITNHNVQVSEDKQFKVGNITVTDPNNYIVRSDSTYLNTWDSISEKLIEPCGGYLWVRHETDGNYIDYLSDFSTLSPQTIEFGKNLLDISKTTKGEDIATAIIPLGSKQEDSETRLTIESVNDGKDYVYSPEAVAKYGWIFKTVTYDDVTLPENLMSKGNQYLAETINLVSSIELTAVDLSAINKDLSSFHIGTYARVITAPHDLNQLMLVTKLSLNLADATSNKLTLGTTYQTFTEQSASEKKEYSLASKKIEQINSEVTQMPNKIMANVKEECYVKEETNQLVNSAKSELSQTKIVSSGSIDDIITNGTYYLTVDVFNKPANQNGWLDVQMYNDQYIYQRYVTNAGKVFERIKAAGAWEDWCGTFMSEIWTYTKRMDGTVECVGNMELSGVEFATKVSDSWYSPANAYPLTYPVTFADDPQVIFSTSLSSSPGVVLTYLVNQTTSSADMCLQKIGTGTVNMSLAVYAFGRWK